MNAEQTETKFNVTFKRGPEVIAKIEGQRRVTLDGMTVGDALDVTRAEHLLEKLTGLRVHIEQAE